MQRYCVLVVEDDPGNKRVLANIFKSSGCIDGIFEENGDCILDIIRACTVDLILMDITLTNSTLHGEPVDGLELTRQIKKLNCNPMPPVVLLTAHCMAGDADRFLNASTADAYIAKPLQDVEGFIVWLSLTVEEFRARQGAAAVEAAIV
ncbi:MAG TPA: response regulator [Phycisphaerae bacterium]|nr:response regulator [Phycisphaerae bacterium]